MTCSNLQTVGLGANGELPPTKRARQSVDRWSPAFAWSEYEHGRADYRHAISEWQCTRAECVATRKEVEILTENSRKDMHRCVA